MPQHVGGVVVAVAAQRLADGRSIRGVGGAAAEGAPVFAGSAVAARSATLVPGTMDRPERRRGEGDEQAGAVADGGGDVLAAEEARADEVEGVARVEA